MAEKVMCFGSTREMIIQCMLRLLLTQWHGFERLKKKRKDVKFLTNFFMPFFRALPFSVPVIFWVISCHIIFMLHFTFVKLSSLPVKRLNMQQQKKKIEKKSQENNKKKRSLCTFAFTTNLRIKLLNSCQLLKKVPFYQLREKKVCIKDSMINYSHFSFPRLSSVNMSSWLLTFFSLTIY